MFDPRNIIEALNRHQVEYITIGGFAATLYGCPEQTFDLDILYADTPANRQRLLAALSEVEARWDEPLPESVLQRQPVFALNTKFGDLDILSEVPGVGTYEQAKSHMQSMSVGGEAVPILDLPTLCHERSRCRSESTQAFGTRLSEGAPTARLACIKLLHSEETCPDSLSGSASS